MISKIGAITLIAILAASIFTIGVIALQFQKTLESTGDIESAGFDVQDDLGTSISSVAWGTLEPGSIKEISYNLVSTGSVDQTVGMTYNLDSAIGTLTWDIGGQIIAPGDSLSFTFTLSIFASAPLGSFNFQIVIEAIA